MTAVLLVAAIAVWLAVPDLLDRLDN